MLLSIAIGRKVGWPAAYTRLSAVTEEGTQKRGSRALAGVALAIRVLDCAVLIYPFRLFEVQRMIGGLQIKLGPRFRTCQRDRGKSGPLESLGLLLVPKQEISAKCCLAQLAVALKH